MDSRNSSAEANVSTRKPTDDRRFLTDRRSDSSSSTTQTTCVLRSAMHSLQFVSESRSRPAASLVGPRASGYPTLVGFGHSRRGIPRRAPPLDLARLGRDEKARKPAPVVASGRRRKRPWRQARRRTHDEREREPLP